jgi:thiamine biosynthesis protein ThiS
MKLIINGEITLHPNESLTLENLLNSLDFNQKPVVIELNQQALHASSTRNITLKEGDQIEIIQITAGG